MKFLFVLSLLNGIGGNALWLSAGPYIESKAKALGFIGLIAAIRQMSFLFGSVSGGIQADYGRPLKKYVFVEFLVVLLSVLLLIFKDSEHGFIFPLWAALRFFLAGLGSNLSYKIFGGTLKSWSWGSTANLLFIQGSFFFASIFAYSFPFFLEDYFKLAIQIDIATSLLLVIYLLLNFKTSLDVEYEGKKGSVWINVYDSILGCWTRDVRGYSILRCLLLVATGGSLVFSIQLSKQYFGSDFKNFFYLFFFIYGFNAWVGSYIVKVVKNDWLVLKSSFFVVAGSCVFFFPSSVFAFMCGVFLFTLGYWLGILASNQLVLSFATSSNSGKISSSLIFQISIIFSVTEVAYGVLASKVSITQVVFARLSVCFIALILLYRRRGYVP